MKRHFIRLAAIALLISFCACQAGQESIGLEEGVDEELEEAPVIAEPNFPTEEAPALEEKDRVELKTRIMAEKPRLAEREDAYKLPELAKNPVAAPAEAAEEESEDDSEQGAPSQLHYQQPVQFKKPIPRPEDPEFMI